jgi:hypothetical protein
MTEQAKEKVIELLKTIKSDQTVTIEYLTREYLKNKGLDWQGYDEITLQVELEKYLTENNLIVDTGNTTKLYTINQP